eukprot:1397290-Amphidinium_carterae.1
MLDNPTPVPGRALVRTHVRPQGKAFTGVAKILLNASHTALQGDTGVVKMLLLRSGWVSLKTLLKASSWDH